MATGKVIVTVVEVGEKGSSHSGNYGHAGRPGKLGGSVAKGSGAGAAEPDWMKQTEPTRQLDKTQLADMTDAERQAAREQVVKDIQAQTNPVQKVVASQVGTNKPTLGGVPVGAPPGSAFAQQHQARKAAYTISGDRATKTSSNNRVRTTIRPVDNGQRLLIEHQANPTGNHWVSTTVGMAPTAKTEYEAFRLADIGHNNLLRAAQRAGL